jgi:hypothetical protein
MLPIVKSVDKFIVGSLIEIEANERIVRLNDCN